MVELADGNDLLKKLMPRLNNIVNQHVNIFRTALFSGLAAGVETFTIELTTGAKPL